MATPAPAMVLPGVKTRLVTSAPAMVLPGAKMRSETGDPVMAQHVELMRLGMCAVIDC